MESHPFLHSLLNRFAHGFSPVALAVLHGFSETVYTGGAHFAETSAPFQDHFEPHLLIRDCLLTIR